MSNLSYMQKATDRGQLQIHVTTERGFFPIKDASIRLSYTGNPTEIIEELSTDISGQTAAVELPAPPLEYSMEPSEFQPYSEYTIQVNASGYRPINISGISVLPDKTSIQNVRMETATVENPLERNIVITANTLYGNFPPKIPEDEIKPITESGEIVLSRVVIPEYVIVHDGPPSDSSANDYYVRYRDYIKNVACCEIYSTWSESTIEANKRFFASEEEVPKQAYTMGIKNIMQAKKILIVVNGENKADIVERAFFGPVTPEVPASILQLHNDVTVVADEAALSKLTRY